MTIFKDFLTINNGEKELSLFTVDNVEMITIDATRGPASTYVLNRDELQQLRDAADAALQYMKEED